MLTRIPFRFLTSRNQDYIYKQVAKESEGRSVMKGNVVHLRKFACPSPEKFGAIGLCKSAMSMPHEMASFSLNESKASA